MRKYENWKPRTELGRDVVEGKITSLDLVFSQGKKIKEPAIIDKFLPNLKNEIIFIGGSPGKGGGSKRTPTRRTARMHRSGRRYRVSAMVVVGAEGFIGIGKATAIEHKDAVDKALENAKLNVIPVKRGCGSWECGCGGEHSIPMKVEGYEGSVKVTLMPAPKGIGLCVHDEAKKMLRIAGIKDVWADSDGKTSTRINYTLALFDAFKKLNRMKDKND